MHANRKTHIVNHLRPSVSPVMVVFASQRPNSDSDSVGMVALIARPAFAVAARSPSSFVLDPPLDVSRSFHSSTSLPEIGKPAGLRDSDRALPAPEFHPNTPSFPRTDRLSPQLYRSSNSRSPPCWWAEELPQRPNVHSSAVRRCS